MANDILLNTTTDLNGKTLVTAEGDRSITGLLSFSRGASAPFAVGSGAANVANLDADKVDGQHAPAGTIVGTSDAQVLTNKTLTSPTITTPTIDTPTVSASINLTGGQVSFPATQVPSAGANVLDDYEEGTWTPVLGGSSATSGQSYSSQVGHYVKIGKMVFASFNFVLTTKGTITGTLQLQALPFTVENLSSHAPAISISGWSGLATSIVWLGGNAVPNTTTADIRAATAAATASVSLATADINNGVQIFGHILYRASA